MSKWIDAEFEKPDVGVTVFVTGKGFFNSYEASVQRWELAEDPMHPDDDPHWFGTREMEPYQDYKITHWMPLPKAPKKSKKLKIESKTKENGK